MEIKSNKDLFNLLTEISRDLKELNRGDLATKLINSMSVSDFPGEIFEEAGISLSQIIKEFKGIDSHIIKKSNIALAAIRDALIKVGHIPNF